MSYAETVAGLNSPLVATAGAAESPAEPRTEPTQPDAARPAPDQPAIRIAVHGDIGAVQEKWRALQANADCTAFQSFDWIAGWQRHIGGAVGAIPAIAVGEDAGGRPLFIFALAVEPHGGLRRLTWLGSDLCDYNAPILARDFAAGLRPDRFAALWRETLGLLAAEGLRFDYVDMQRMPEMLGAARNPFLDLAVTVHPSGAHACTLGDDWERFYAGKRSASTRKTARKQFKHLTEKGPVRFVDTTETKDRRQTLDVLMAQKEQSLARMGVDNLFDRPGYRAFFRAAVSDPAMAGLIRISKLVVGAATVATSLGLAFGDCFYLVLASYDGGPIAQHGPGRAHLHELLRHTIGEGFHRFDFTVGDEAYKRDWCEIEARLYDYLAPQTFRGWRLVQSVTLFRRLKRMIKQTPVLWRIFSRLRAMVAAGSGHRDGTTAA